MKICVMNGLKWPIPYQMLIIIRQQYKRSLPKIALSGYDNRLNTKQAQHEVKTYVNDYRMVLPRRVESQQADDDYGKFIISPLERGYGHTLGAALKRLMLTGLPGAAITAVRIEGSSHLYDTIPGVRENIAQVLFQLKQVRPIIAGNTPQQIELQLEWNGHGIVSAGDILCPPNVRILNSELYLMSVEKGSGQISLIVEIGEGYRESTESPYEYPEGYITLAANFSPVSRVIYDVDAARVRQRTNYDKLIMDVWTDGTITPQEALSKASIQFIRHLQIFDPESENLLKDPGNFIPPEPLPEPEINPLYDVPIEALDLSTRVFNSLRRTGITSVGDVIDMLQRGEEAMLAIRNFGQTSLDELKEKLIESGYLRDNLDDEEA